MLWLWLTKVDGFVVVREENGGPPCPFNLPLPLAPKTIAFCHHDLSTWSLLPLSSALDLSFEPKHLARAGRPPLVGMAPPEHQNPKPQIPYPLTPKPSYAAALFNEPPLHFAIDDLPKPFFEDGLVSIQITEESYLRGLERCKTNLVGRISSPIKTQDLLQQLRSCWPSLENWTAAPLGKGFFMLQFQSLNDMQRVWSMGSIKLHNSMMRLIKWTPSFSPLAYKNTFAQVWVRFWDLGFAFWDNQTLFEIAKGVGTPLKLDPRTQQRTVGLYARVLVDVDFSQPLLSKLRVTRANGEIVIISVDYETEPIVCNKCGIVGHREDTCRLVFPAATTASPLVNRGRPFARSRNRRRNNSVSRRRSNQHAAAAVPENLDLTLGVEVGVLNTQTASKVFCDQNLQFVNHIPTLSKLTSEQSSSLDSAPPGFRKHDSNALVPDTNSNSTPIASGIVPALLGPSDIHLNSVCLLIGETSTAREEGEFTSVISKKTKKQLKLAVKEKSKTKPTLCKLSNGRPLLQKGAKHKLAQ